MSSSAPVMIFHVPFRLNPEAKSASGIRPVRMRKAFEDIGYTVLEVSGTSRERRGQMADIKAKIKAGLTVDFVYSEASTQPNTFTDPYFSLHPFFDNNFLAWCRRRGMKVGLFYRDIYWRFADYRRMIGWLYATALRSVYLLELIGYLKAVDVVYVPSLEMSERLPLIPRNRFVPLPPGGDATAPASGSERLNLLYVGGIGNHYRLHELVRAVELVPGASLTMCVRVADWEKVKTEYEPLIGPNTTVVHASGSQLETLYRWATVGVLAVEPVDYWRFAMPVKFGEYVGASKPILASEGIGPASVIGKENLGWVVHYDCQSLLEALRDLESHPEKLVMTARTVEKAQERHSWAARAQQVATQLTPSNALGGSKDGPQPK